MSQAGASTRRWLQMREVGSVLGMRFVLLVAATVGRRPMRALLRAIVLYYALVQREARAASRAFLRRVGRPSGFWAVYGHMLRFAQCAADRPLLIAGRRDAFVFEMHGSEHLSALRRQGRGALLLGAHLGSFEALSAQAVQDGLVVHVVAYFRNARRINRVLEGLGSTMHARLLEPGSGIDLALRARDCIERGEFVAVLGDRQVAGKSVLVDFLGEPAAFPTGPIALAAALGCPVILTFALHRPPNRYQLYCEPLAERVTLPRTGREQALRAYVQRYAERLEHHCRLAPDNWFNFYDFWRE